MLLLNIISLILKNCCRTSTLSYSALEQPSKTRSPKKPYPPYRRAKEHVERLIKTRPLLPPKKKKKKNWPNHTHAHSEKLLGAGSRETRISISVCARANH